MASKAQRRVTIRDAKRIHASAMLDMLASQLRESVDGRGKAPSPWRFDDWLRTYRDLYSGS
jgi:hypothetical protein